MHRDAPYRSFSTARVVAAPAAVLLVAPLLLVLVLGCAKSSRTYEDPGNVGFGVDGGSSGGGVTRLAECAESTRDPYVIASDNTFYEFVPPTLEFKSKGVLACPTGGATPTSMAVDRQGVAWVRHSDGSIWKVSTKDLSCEPTKWEAPAQAFAKFGMGFSSESKGSSNEVLFLSDSAGAGLGRIEEGSYAFRFIGAYTGDLAGRGSELTGTGDGKLYGFFTTAPAQIAEISKGTGQVVGAPKQLAGVFAGEAWAFSFYGGDFYVYTAGGSNGGPPLANKGSNVTRYSPSDGSIKVVKENVGFTIVGAGVSTCAPTSNVR